MSARVMSLLIWAAVAASAVYWGLRLFTRPTPVPGQAVVALATPPAQGDLTRLLGAPPVQPVVEVEALPADSRFKLVGVVAPRIGQGSGLALISVDGKPARTVAVGRELEPGVRLLSVGHRQAEIGAARGSPGTTLALPPLPEANRGRPGEAMAGAPPGFPGAGPQMPGMQPGQAGLNLPRLPGMQPNAQPNLMAQPQLPVVQLPEQTEQPAEGNAQQTR